MELVFLLFFLPFTNTVKHALTCFLTASSGLESFPEFVATSKVDGVYVEYCNSIDKRAEPRQSWVKEMNKNDTEHLQRHTQACVFNSNFLQGHTRALKEHFKLTAGIHIFQEMFSCELDDETGTVGGSDQFGYDGEDFVSLDLKNLTWLFTQQASTYKNKWISENRESLYKTKILTFCPQCLEKYLKYGKNFLQRKDLPSVSLLQKSPSSPVSCHATGFYPDRATMFWRKDGEELHEDVDHGETLPNHDGTFQMRVDLDISSVKPEDWRRYDCVFQLSGVENNIITKLDKALIRTNKVPPSQVPVGAVIGVVVGLMLLSVCITGLFIWRKKNNGFSPANTSESSLSSERKD